MTDHLPIKPGTGAMPAPRKPLETSLESARKAAEKLEATFLAEMLKVAGFGEQVNTFSGGQGEDHFASFHRQAIADKIAATGGIGLSEHFLRSIMEKTNE